jgi:membrane protein
MRTWLARRLGGLTARQLAVRTYAKIIDQAVLTRAAAISFYAVAAFVPFMGLVIVLLAYSLPWFDRMFAGGVEVEPLDPLEALLPREAVSLIRGEMMRLSAEPHPALLSFAVALLLWLSSSVFVEIIDAMHAIGGCRDTRPFWQRRLIAMVMTLGTAAILISAMLTIVIWPQIPRWLGLSAGASAVATFTHAAVVTLTVYLTLALALRVGCNRRNRELWLTPGCALGTAMVLAASLLLRYYAHNLADYGATYGSLAGIMLLMTWLWLSSLGLLFAAALNKVIEDASEISRRFGTAFALQVPRGGAEASAPAAAGPGE